MEEAVYTMPNPSTPHQCVSINPKLCKVCHACVEACRCDILVPAGEKHQPPLVLYPEECWYCGCCVEACPVPGAIEMNYPLNQKVVWKRKATGEIFRIGMKNPPPPNNRPPIM
jgi:NAD-dependent dihydropyrimidine dehydrogenase PreA subunit